jgi:perosamine synthetase
LISIAKPNLGEEEVEAVVAVLRSGQLAQGKVVEAFEQRFTELARARYAIAVSNGTAALHLALLAEGVGPGDEVITSPFTFTATANAILYTGATPVFADICEDTLNLDPIEVEAKITARTKAILPVHLYGQPADMPEIATIAARYGLSIVEDACQAHGASIDDLPVGSHGSACYSFYATKNVTTGEGGIITTNNPMIAERLRMLRSHGQRERYRHEILGYNYRLTDVQAAIGLVQLNHLEEFTARRIANAAFLTNNLPYVSTPVVRPTYRHVYHQYTIRVPGGRDEASRRLIAAGVGCSIHYPIPVHQQSLYRDLGYRDTLPTAERASQEVLSLPVHPSLTPDDLRQIVRAVGELPRSLTEPALTSSRVALMSTTAGAVSVLSPI